MSVIIGAYTCYNPHLLYLCTYSNRYTVWSGGDRRPGKTRGKGHSTCSPQDGPKSVHVDWR